MMEPGPRTASLPAAIQEPGVIAILRGLSPDRVQTVAATLSAAGIQAVEVTFNSPSAEVAIRGVSTASRGQLLVGAGTVRTPSQARAAVLAGALYIVTPAVNPAVIEWCVRSGVPCIAGALTPTEVDTADRAGATAVKIFPAARLGADYLRDLAGPFDQVAFVAVGGIDDQNSELMIRRGAAAVGVGSWLSGPSDTATVASRAKALLDAVARGRPG